MAFKLTLVFFGVMLCLFVRILRSMLPVYGEILEVYSSPFLVRVHSRQYSLFIVSVYRSTDVNMHDGAIFPPHMCKLVTVPSIHQLWAHNLQELVNNTLKENPTLIEQTNTKKALYLLESRVNKWRKKATYM